MGKKVTIYIHRPPSIQIWGWRPSTPRENKYPLGPQCTIVSGKIRWSMPVPTRRACAARLASCQGLGSSPIKAPQYYNLTKSLYTSLLHTISYTCYSRTLLPQNFSHTIIPALTQSANPSNTLSSPSFLSDHNISSHPHLWLHPPTLKTPANR